MNSKIIIAVLLVVGSVPLATAPFANASHFSVGGEDAVGVAPSEDATSPSIPSDGDLWARGTAQNCQPSTYDDDPEALGADNAEEKVADNEEEASTFATRDPLCGDLIYNKGAGELERVSPLDQDYPASGISGLESLRFDVIVTNNAGNYGLGWCPPFWCFGATAQAFQDVASAAGISDNGTNYEQNAGSATENQGYSVDVKYPNSAQVFSDASGQYEGDGWVAPLGDRSFVGFLEAKGLDGVALDTDGDGVIDQTLNNDGRIDNTELKWIVDALQASGDLNADAIPQVCGFTSEASISISAADSGFCEIDFAYIDEEKDVTEEEPRWDEYSNRCDSPTYVCGQNTPAWYANLVMLPLPAHGIVLNSANGVSESTLDYDIWHFVAAPSEQDVCSNAEVGFDFEGDTTGAAPYLAHDLDIYEQAAQPVGVTQGENVIDWTDDFEDSTEDPTTSQATDLEIDLPQESYILLKDDRIEPNADGDTSQSLAGVQADPDDPDLVREAGNDPCAQFRPGQEKVLEPWVDYIDNSVTYSVPSVIGYTAPPVLDPGANVHHDESNANVAGFYESDGYVGMFTDINDDGDYDQADGESVTDDIQNVGAYPLLYDMHVATDDEGNVVGVDPNAGCKPGFAEDFRFAGLMEDAGYGPRTGLIQAVYLNEPTVLYSSARSEVVEHLQGNTAFVFGTQAILAYMDAPTPDPSIVNAVQATLDKIPVNQDDDPNNDLVLGDDNVVFPGLDLGLNSDFGDQCRADTGQYALQWEFFHTCDVPGFDCSGDTIATNYVFELADGTIGGSNFPTFTKVNSTEAYNFHTDAAGFDSNTGLNQWFDVDPFDGDSARNWESDSSPPTPE